MNIENIIGIIKETDAIFFDDLLRSDVRVKGDSDFVTRADLEVSEHVKRRLKEEFPAVGFISEEDYDSLDFDAEKEYWILDPIDGTTNFMHALPFNCLSLALWSHGESVLGVIYSPYTGELFTAEKGKGAFLNGHPIRVSEHAKLSDCVGLLEFNAYYKNEVDMALDHARRIYLACQDIRTFGSAALEFAYVACGRADVYLGRYLKPWDFAAGLCIVREAGGVVTGLGKELDVTCLKQHVVCTNGAAHEAFCRILMQ
ncbi:MAG: inositol monophosphatase [Clostridia bacterium]|nr:inositol monophosphatase [Clostridia bacterium]